MKTELKKQKKVKRININIPEMQEPKSLTSEYKIMKQLPKNRVPIMLESNPKEKPSINLSEVTKINVKEKKLEYPTWIH